MIILITYQQLSVKFFIKPNPQFYLQFGLYLLLQISNMIIFVTWSH